MRRWIAAIGAAVLGAVPALAGEIRPLTLDDCLAYADRHNLDLRIAYTQLEMSGAHVREAGARYLPSLSLDGYYTQYDTAPTQPVTLSPQIQRILQRLAPNQPNVSSNFSVERTPQNPSEMKLAVSQPLFTSGKLYTTLQLRRDEQRVGALQERGLHADVLLAVEESFDELLLAEEGRALNETRLPQEREAPLLDSADTSRSTIAPQLAPPARFVPSVGRDRGAQCCRNVRPDGAAPAHGPVVEACARRASLLHRIQFNAGFPQPRSATRSIPLRRSAPENRLAILAVLLP